MTVGTNFFHLLRKAYLRVAIDWHASVLLRRALHELNIGVDGVIVLLASFANQ